MGKQRLMVILPAVAALDLIVPFLVAIPYTGYSHRRMAMSVLGGPQSPLGRRCDARGILGPSVSANASAVADRFIWHWLRGHVRPFPDRRGEDAGGPEREGSRHRFGRWVMAMLFAPMVLALLWRRTGQGTLAAIGYACFALALACFALFVMADKPRFTDSWVAQEGLWQRLALLWMYVPCVLWAVA